MSNTSIGNPNTSSSHKSYETEDVESCHKAAAITLTSERDTECNYQNGNQDVPLDLEDDDDITDDDNLDDDDDENEESINQRVKPEDHDCSEECGFCSEEDSK